MISWLTLSFTHCVSIINSRVLVSMNAVLASDHIEYCDTKRCLRHQHEAGWLITVSIKRYLSYQHETGWLNTISIRDIWCINTKLVDWILSVLKDIWGINTRLVEWILSVFRIYLISQLDALLRYIWGINISQSVLFCLSRMYMSS